MTLLKKKNQNAPRSRPPTEADKSVSAYSYHNARNEQEDNTGRDTKRLPSSAFKPHFWLSRIGFIIFVIVSVICLYTVLDLSSNPNIVFLGSSTNSQLDNLYKPAFIERSKSLFKSSLLNHNKITVDTNSITNTLNQEFPEFSSVSITLPLINHRPIIYVVPGSPSIVLNNSQGQYLLNQNGVAILFASSGTSFNYLNLPTVDDQSGLTVKLGKPALTSQNVSFIQTVTQQLAAKQDKVSVMTLPQATSELDVRLTGKPYFGKFNLQDDDPRIQVGSFLAAEHYLSTQNITPSQYIDARTDGRVYYQ